MYTEAVDPRVQMANRIMEYASNLPTRQQELMNQFVSNTLERLTETEHSAYKVEKASVIEQRLDKAFSERNARGDWNYNIWTYRR